MCDCVRWKQIFLGPSLASFFFLWVCVCPVGGRWGLSSACLMFCWCASLTRFVARSSLIKASCYCCRCCCSRWPPHLAFLPLPVGADALSPLATRASRIPVSVSE